MKLLGTLGMFIAVCLLADMVGAELPKMLQESRYTPDVQNFVTVARLVPWSAVLFSFLFAIAVWVTERGDKEIGFEEVAAFTLICPIIPIVKENAGFFLLKVLDALHIPGWVVLNGLHAFFIGLVAHHGLFLNIGITGCLLLMCLAGGLQYGVQFLALPAEVGRYWYTIIGTTLVLLSFRAKRV